MAEAAEKKEPQSAPEGTSTKPEKDSIAPEPKTPTPPANQNQQGEPQNASPEKPEPPKWPWGNEGEPKNASPEGPEAPKKPWGSTSLVTNFSEKMNDNQPSNPATKDQPNTTVTRANVVAPEFRHKGAPISKDEQGVMGQEFLQNFEHVELFYPVSGERGHSNLPLSTHPHLNFRMCTDERKALTTDMVNTKLSRQIDRGTQLLQSLGESYGFEIGEDWYVEPRQGILAFDVKAPNPPEGKTEQNVLDNLASALQEACTLARQNAKAQSAAR
ncbi:MAG: hypothetical protein CMM93_05485 [Rickettsiales bacterium]|nr:hypothetical protein [Rickettsiales bacterium]